VKAGAIIPMGPLQQYASEKPNAPWEIRIYPGADGRFTIYEDEGDNYNYEDGKSARINLRWDNQRMQLTIDTRKGSFNHMVSTREFRIILVSHSQGVGLYESSNTGKVVQYKGALLKVNL
jgi:alpha-D-xyloside xylohydrolase